MSTRPPLALLVEGDGEYAALQNLVLKHFGKPYRPVPTSNARGIGNLIANFEQHLTDIVLTSRPRTIIVTLDKADVVTVQFSTCAELRSHLEQRAGTWLTAQQENVGLHPLPSRIVVVVQVPRFESWLTADPVALRDAQFTTGGFVPHVHRNVDEQIVDHREYLARSLRGGYRKRPAEVARISKALRPAVMKDRSRSFRKFWGEVTDSYIA